MNKRIYKVLDRENAIRLGAHTFSNGEYSQYALVAVRDEKLDNVVAWGYKKEPLERKAEERNRDIAMLGRMVRKANKVVDTEGGE